MKLIFFILLLQFICFTSITQVIPHVRYTTKDGLISDRITAITQDEKGFIWFGSFFGICKFDGIKFNKVSLHPKQQNKYVTFLLPDSNKIYAGFLFQGGLAEFASGKVTSHFIQSKDSANSNEFVCAGNDNKGGILLCNTKNEIYQFVNNKFQYLYTLNNNKFSRTTSIAKDKYNNLWVGTEKGLVIVPYPYTSETYYYASAKITSLIKDREGKVICTMQNGNTTIITSYDGWQNDFINSTLITTSSTFQALLFSGKTDKGFWAVNNNKQLVKVLNKTLSFYKVPFHLNTIVNVIFADRENNIWIANEPGVIKVTNQSVKTFFFDELAPGGTNVMCENDSVIWVTNSKNLYRIQGNNFIKVPEFRFNGEGYISDLKSDAQNNLWLTFWDGGIAKTKWNGRQLIILKSYDKKMSGQLMMADDVVWVIGSTGIYIIRNDKVINHFRPVNTNNSPSIITAFALDEQQRQLWVGDNSLGITKIDYAYNYGKFSFSVTDHITTRHGLKDMAVRSLMFDVNKNLWVGTRFGGIYKVTKNSYGKHTVENVTTKAALECTRTTQIIEEKKVAAWFATCNGIYRYNYKSNQWDNYTTGNGLVNAEIFSIDVDEKNNRLWAAGAEGVSEINFADKALIAAPLISIIDIKVLGKSDTSSLYNKSSVKYNASQNSIGFVFAGASFIDEKKIKYKYLLKGYDKNWSEPVMTNNVNYASLPYGKYVFKVLAANAHNQWSSNPATFEFEIIMPIYKRPWFLFALILIATLVVYFIRIQQLKQQFKIEELRLNIARDLHDDVGSTLGSINLLSKTASRKLDNHLSSQDITPIFEKIGQSAEDTLDAMDDIVWSINPDKDKLTDLNIRMREFAIPLFEAKNIEFNFVFDADSNKSIPMNLRRNAFLIFKESVHNIIKHADANYINVEMKAQHEKLSLKISDNGKGFNSAQPTSRNGLKNMHNRAAICHALLHIKSSDAGTTIEFIGPIV